MTTLPLVLSIPPRNTDVEAWRARMEAKRTERHRHEAIEHAAIVASGRTIRRPTAPMQPTERQRAGWHEVRPCVDCGHPTRPSRATITRFPGTRQRATGGRCANCYQRLRRGGAA